MLRCNVCQSSHPSGFPKVCLVLGHFLEEQFPKEYALRRAAVQLKQADSKHENPNACKSNNAQFHLILMIKFIRYRIMHPLRMIHSTCAV